MKITTFIKLNKDKIKEYLIYLQNKYDLEDKFKTVSKKFIDIVYTGFIIWFIIIFHDTKIVILKWISYGLVPMLAMYYFGWLIDKIKGNV